MAHGSVMNGARRIIALRRNSCAPLALALTILLSASHVFGQAPSLGPATNSDASTPKVQRQASPPVPPQSHSDDASNTNSADAHSLRHQPPALPGVRQAASPAPARRHKSPPPQKRAKT